jgi:hypothetical protein
MSTTNEASRPTRNRTAVSTYNLKILNDNAHHTQRCYKQSNHNTDRPHPVSVRTNENSPALSKIVHNSSSSSLTSLSPSPLLRPPSPRSAATLHQTDGSSTIQKKMLKLPVTAKIMTEFECFNARIGSRGHYYSASALYTCGVWVGYLSPDKQKKQYRGLPSFNELKMNFADMSLPCPPSSVGASGNNRSAVCRGCFGEHSALITLREVQFIKNRVSPICACIAEGLISNRSS